MIFFTDMIRGLPGYGASIDEGWFTPSLAAVDPSVPYLPLVNAGDPAPAPIAIVTWLEIQAGAIAPVSLPAHLLLQPSRGARMSTLLRF